jgi:tryptophanyl-tRNA synthetase
MALALTGIKPTGTPHLGNYLGMIRPALALARDHDTFYFVADAHALTTQPDRDELEGLVREVGATWLACGLDPARSAVYRQSDVPEVFELAWLLSCVTPKGLLNRAHAYKAAVADNEAHGRDPDDGVNAGLYGYPVLMAADILAPAADLVPVGRDQEQHLEITRDVAGSFNARYGEVLTVPDAVVDDAVATITGTDGRKMSKSYGNVIPVLADPDDLRARIARIRTDSRRADEPKDPGTCAVYALYRHLAPPASVGTMRERYLTGGVGYAETKEALFGVVEERFREPRRRYAELVADPAQHDRVLSSGTGRARERAGATLAAVRAAVGFA